MRINTTEEGTSFPYPGFPRSFFGFPMVFLAVLHQKTEDHLPCQGKWPSM